MKTDIIVHLPAYGRPTEFRMAAKALNRLLGEFAELGYTSRVVCAGTRQREAQIAREFGFDYINVRNEPVGYKFNQLAKHIVSKYRFTWYMEYCSDNVIAPGYAKLAHEMLTSGHEAIYLSHFYCVELKGKRCKLFGPGCSNVGRIVHGKYVRKAYQKYRELYPVRKSKRMDAFFRKRMIKVGAEWAAVPTEQPMLVDVKGALSINPMSNFTGYDAVSLRGEFPEYYEINTAWQQQEKSGQTKSASTSPPPLTPTTTPESAEPTATTAPTKRTRSKSSPAQPQAASARPRKSSTPRRKTTTGKGKSSSEE